MLIPRAPKRAWDDYFHYLCEGRVHFVPLDVLQNARKKERKLARRDGQLGDPRIYERYYAMMLVILKGTFVKEIACLILKLTKS